MQRLTEPPQFRGRAVAQALTSHSYKRIFEALNILEALDADDIARSSQEVKLFFSHGGFQGLTDLMKPDSLSTIHDLPAAGRAKSVSARKREKQKAKKREAGKATSEEEDFPEPSSLDPGPQYSVPIPINGTQIQLPLGIYLRIQSCSLLSRFTSVPEAAEAVLLAPSSSSPSSSSSSSAAAASSSAASSAGEGEVKSNGTTEVAAAEGEAASKELAPCDRVLKMLLRTGAKIHKGIKAEVALDKIAAAMALPVIAASPKGVEWLLEKSAELPWLEALVEVLNGMLRVPMLATCPAQHDGLAGAFTALYLALTPFTPVLGLPGASERAGYKLSEAAEKAQKEGALYLIQTDFANRIVLPCLHVLGNVFMEQRADKQTFLAARGAILCTLGFAESLRTYGLHEHFPARVRTFLASTSSSSSSSSSASTASSSAATDVTTSMEKMTLESAGKPAQKKEHEGFVGDRRPWVELSNRLALLSQEYIDGALNHLIPELLLYTTGVGPAELLFPKCASTLCIKRDVKGQFAKCGRCARLSYCSRECQRMDWSAHKTHCTAPVKATNAPAAALAPAATTTA